MNVRPLALTTIEVIALSSRNGSVRYFYCYILLLLSSTQLCAQAEFVENKGQWPGQVRFRAELPSGAMWAEDHAFTFNFYDPKILEYLHPLGNEVDSDPKYKSHAYKLQFVGSNVPVVSGNKPAKHYYNYYQGSDESKWASRCQIFSRCDFNNIYDNIDLILYSSNGNVKYDFIVRAGASPNDIVIEMDGANMQLESVDSANELVIKTSVNEVREKAPYAYQIINGALQEVKCHYKLVHGKLQFSVGKYNHALDLVIDPEIVFSTYIGSTANNFGFTACDDSQGNLISGAAVFQQGYPTTIGAYSADFNTGIGNYMDVAISKFNSLGSSLLYSTYIGGSGQETPHSVIADNNDNFIVFGVTGSEDYPVTTGAYQTVFQGGPALSMSQFFTSSHANGTDMFITKFNADGTLTASTFMGGNDNDGLNYAGQLFYNYGDAFRGEVNVDASDNIFVASVTASQNFPMIANSLQATHGGAINDGVVFKMNSTLTGLLWSTYLGGNGEDACYALEFKSDGTLIIAGGTLSANFPFVTGGADVSHNGQTDGFILLIDSTNFSVQSGTFVGTADYDQVYFVQTDDLDNVYAYGQTAGTMSITAGLYGQPNSGQFISKYTSNLSTLTWNTTIGTGSGEIDISPTAFLVSDCEQIYISGWGGTVNSSFCAGHPCSAVFSTTVGLPTTADAFQSTTDGSDFYLCVLNPNATGLLYASYLGGTQSAEHVDGGTSRFDKNGSVFQAVCAGCHNNDDFPTTPGVWSNTNNSTGCNIAVFRFDLNAVQAHVQIDGPDQVCEGIPVDFLNFTVGASSFLWNFGDGDSSTVFQPTHTFSQEGTYTISLMGMDDALCVTADTAYVTITILPGVHPTVQSANLICPGDQVQLNATGSANLHWVFSASLSATNIPNPIASPLTTTTYSVIDFNDCDADTLTVTVPVSIPITTISPAITMCIGEETQLSATGGVSYSWSPTTGLDNPNISDPTSSPLVTTLYIVTITTNDNCVIERQVQINIVNNSPGGAIYPPIDICQGTMTQLHAIDGGTWTWTPASSLSSGFVQHPYASPSDTTIYSVLITNACGQGTDFVTVNVLHPHIVADGGGTICPGKSVNATADGGVTYLWQPTLYANPFDADTTTLTPPQTTWFTVTGVDQNNCHQTDSVFVFVLPRTQVDAGPDQYFEFPGSAYLLGNAFGFEFFWWPTEGLSCTDCIFPIASPQEETWYHLSIIDNEGCVSDDSVFVKPYFPIYVPNTITPNGDGINDFFRAYGVNIKGFHLLIFDRWGVKIFESHDINEAWTGGVSKEYYVQNDVYSWVIEYDSIDRREQLVGHVTVAR